MGREGEGSPSLKNLEPGGRSRCQGKVAGDISGRNILTEKRRLAGKRERTTGRKSAQKRYRVGRKDPKGP